MAKTVRKDLKRSIIIHRDDPMYNDIINVGINGFFNEDCQDFMWLTIRCCDKEIIIDNFKEMHELWSAIKEITEKAEALCNERIKAKKTK